MPKAPKPEKGVYEKEPGCGIWWIRFADDTGRIQRECVGMRSTAIKAYHKKKTEVREGRYFPKPKHRASVDELLQDYHKSCESRGVTDLKEIKSRSNWWTARFQGRSACSVTASDIEDARLELSRMKPYGHGYERKAKTLAVATVNKYLAILKAAYFLGIKNEKVEKNPVCQIKFQKENNARVRYLLESEEAKLFEVLPEEYHPMTLLAIHTGLRRMELFQLRWQDINSPQKVLTILRSKNGESRTVPMNDLVISTLKRIVRRLDNPYVFPGKLPGSHITDIPHSWEVFLTNAGIHDFRWHDLRHTFGSRLVMAGVDIYTVQRLMGHKDIKMTMRYAHLGPGHLQNAVNKLVFYKNPTDTKTDTRGKSDKIGFH